MINLGKVKIMNNTTAYIEKYMSQGTTNNIAVRVGIGDRIVADIFKSVETEIDSTTLFDMASVTKAMATTTLCYIALDKGLLHIDDKVSLFFPVPEDKKEMTIKHLLTHTMGIGHKSLVSEGNTYDNIADFILNIPSDVPIGSETLYSCPGYILLGKILEKLFGERLDALFLKYVAAPLDMKYSSFHPAKTDNIVNSNVNADEKGLVNDYNCRFLGGVAGNAGLFSCMDDVTKFALMLINHGSPLISEKTFNDAVKNYTPGMSESRALGFVYVDGRYRQTGILFADGSIGHCGHTGQSVFVNLKTGLYAVILSDATISNTKKLGAEKYDTVMKMREDIYSAIKADLIAKGEESCI